MCPRVLHALSAMVHGRNRHLVAKQSADNTFIVQREVRAFPAQAGCLCIEGGSMCPAQGYQADAKIRSTRPPVIAWTVIMQEDGVTDDAECRFVPLKLT